MATCLAPPSFFFKFPRGNFFCLPTKIFVAKLRAANLLVTTKFAINQFEGGEFNHSHPNLPPQPQPRPQTKPLPSHLSSHAPLTQPRSSLKQKQLPRSNAPLTLSLSPLSHDACERMNPALQHTPNPFCPRNPNYQKILIWVIYHAIANSIYVNLIALARGWQFNSGALI